ncbi:MAG: hypothetical protein ABJC04_08270, partial [Verrucomicrobiota bacterium]
MKINSFVFWLLLAVGLCTSAQSSGARADELKIETRRRDARAPVTPIEIKSGVAQLFVDDFIIETQTNLTRTLHQPKKDNGGNFPVIAIENEFGDVNATLEANGTIVFDSCLKKFVMFALAFSAPTGGEDRVRLYRFTSPDAMNWTKGDDGKPERILFNLLDAKSGRRASNIDLFSCDYDER